MGFKSAGNLKEDPDHSGVSEFQAAQKRLNMRKNVIQGGGEGDGQPAGRLSSVPPHQPPQATPPQSDKESDENSGQDAGSNVTPINRNQTPTPEAKPESDAPDQPTKSGPLSRREHYTPRKTNSTNSTAQPVPGASNGIASATATTGGKKNASLAGGSSEDSDNGFQNRLNAAKKFAGKNKRSIIATVSALVVGIMMILGFLALMPLKLGLYMKAIMNDKPYARVEYSLSERVKEFGIEYGCYIATGGGTPQDDDPAGALFSVWEEANAFESQGLIIEPSGGGGINVTLLGQTKTFGNCNQLRDYLNSDKQAKNAFKTAQKDDSHYDGFNKRRGVRTFVAKIYGLGPKRVLDKNEKPEDTKKNFKKILAKASGEGYFKRLALSLNCILSGTDCPEDGRSNDPNIRSETPEGRISSSELAKALESIVNDGALPGSRSALAQILIKNFSSKLVPVVGYIDTAARFDDFIWNGRHITVVRTIRAVQYVGAFYALGAKIGHQIEDGTSITSYQINELLKLLSTLEKSRAYQELFTGESRGIPLDRDKTMKVDDGGFLKKYKSSMGPQHEALTAYLHTVSWVLDKLGDAIAWVLSWVPGLESFEQWLTEKFMDLVEYLLGFLPLNDGVVLGNAIRLGANIMSNDYLKKQMGGVPIKHKTQLEIQDAIANERRESHISLKDRLFSTDDPSSFISRLAVSLPASPMMAIRDGFNTMLATLANPLRVANGGMQLAFEAATNSNSYAASVSEDSEGVEQNGFSQEMLDRRINFQEIKEAAKKAKADGRTIDQIRATDCPEKPEGQPNMCMIDTLAIQSGKPWYTKKDDGGWNSDPINKPAGGGGGSGGTVPTGTASELAKQVLALHPSRITLAGPALFDVQSTANGTPINNADSCFKAVNLDPVLLQVMIQLAQNHTYQVNYIVTEHGCDTAFHPKGMGMDLNNADGRPAWQNAAFMQDAINFMPHGSIGQKGCAGTPTSLSGLGPNKIWYADTCNHLHIDTR